MGSFGAGISGFTPTLVVNSASINFTSIVAGGSWVLALNASGHLYGWGTSGNLGYSGLNFYVPTLLTGGVTWSKVYAGLTFSCGIRKDNAFTYCWGTNNRGECGVGNFVSPVIFGGLGFPTIPVGGVSTPYTFSMISLGTYHACGIEKNSSYMFCWGMNNNGEHGWPLPQGDGGTALPFTVGAPEPCVDW